MIRSLFICCFLLISCGTGKLKVVANISSDLKEVSATEITNKSDIIWVIEDAGNKNKLYGLNSKGSIVKSITIDNVKNIDWEDLASDTFGNIYIGDFGNNYGERKSFYIYKINQPHILKDKTSAEIIDFKLPIGSKSLDFEAFFLLNNMFYIFSKEEKKINVFKVPNQSGNHIAQQISEHSLKGKHNKITSCDISNDGKTIVLLTNNSLWEINGFTSNNFFSGEMTKIKFEHHSQKEGICFKNNKTLYITDERQGNKDGNIYSFKLD